MFGYNKIICPNQSCKYVGKGKREGKPFIGSGTILMIFGLIGLVIFFPVGIILMIVAFIIGCVHMGRKQALICPKCGMKIR